MVTDVERDLAEVDRSLGAGATAWRDTGGGEAATRIAHLHVRRASLSGRPDDLDRALDVVEAAIARVGAWPDLWLLHADLLVRVHEVGAALESLGAVPGLEHCTQARAVRADIELQLGRADGAEELAASLVAEERTWDHLARLANLSSCRGDLDRADELYAAAEDETTAKSMAAFAWIRLERARLALLAGDRSAAGAHVAEAERAYSGHWRLRQARGELLLAEDRIDDAVAEQEQVLALTGRPEAHQALAELHRRAGREEQAGAHELAALAVFSTSARRGEARYLHHLVEIHAARPPATGGPELAVVWARRDVELRPHHLTRATLAWALSRAGRQAEAEAEMGRALSYGLRDPRVMERAAAVFGSQDERAWQMATPVGVP